MVNVKMQVLSDKSVVFEGDKYVNLMPRLTDAGLTPMNMSDIMRVILEAINSKDPEQKDLLKKDINTVDGVAYYGDAIKFVPNAQALKDIRPDTRLSNGVLILTPKEYADLDGEEFSLDSLLKKAGLNQSLRKQAVLSHPVWRALARDDHLLKEFADVIYAKVKKVWGEEWSEEWRDRAMGIYLDEEQESLTMMSWCAGSFFAYKSSAFNSANLGDYFTCLIGLRPEGGGQRDTLDKAISDKGILDEAILDNKVSDSSGVEGSFTYDGQLFVPFYDTEEGNGEL